MKQIIYLVMLILFVASSCVRKSGRLVNDATQAQGYSNSENQNYAVRRNKATKTKSALTQSGPNYKQNPMTGSEIFEKYNEAVFMVYTYDGVNVFQGSGFVVRSKGIAVSNYHVFEGTGMGLEVIKFSNEELYQIKDIIAYDKDEDIIVFSIDSDGEIFPYIPISVKTPKVGEEVYAIGSPLGLKNTFSSGEISQIRGSDLIQISVPIDHGSSGGALINKYGEAIGITTAGIDESGANLNFAININVVNKYLSE